jgi:predicted methyltransferase
MKIMKLLDKILQHIQDTQWHNIEEIKNITEMPSDKLNTILSFLEKQSFIDMNKGKLRITSLGLKFLNL